MSAIVAAILYNLRNLACFTGRDIRAQFWPYAIFLFIVQMIANMIFMIPVMFRMMYRIFTTTFQFAAQHRGTTGMPIGPADLKAFDQVMQTTFADMQSMLVVVAPVGTAIFVILIAAAVARRLHDRGRAGYWGLMPLPFTAFGIATMPTVFSAMARGYANFSVQGIWGSLGTAWLVAVSLNNLLYWIALILLIVMLAQRGAAGANRFGPEVTDWHYAP